MGRNFMGQERLTGLTPVEWKKFNGASRMNLALRKITKKAPIASRRYKIQGE